MEKDKKKAFGRLLADLQEDSFHGDFVETVEHLPKVTKNKDLDALRERLRSRYKRHRLSPTTMYIPRLVLTFAIMMTCAATFLFINRLKNKPQPTPKTTPAQIDSLMKNRKRD